MYPTDEATSTEDERDEDGDGFHEVHVDTKGAYGRYYQSTQLGAPTMSQRNWTAGSAADAWERARIEVHCYRPINIHS